MTVRPFFRCAICRRVVYNPQLHPEDFRPGSDGVFGHGRYGLAAPEHVYDVYGLLDIRDGRVRLFAEYGAGQVRVDREDAVTEVLEGAGYGVAGAIWLVREADDRHVAGFSE